MTEEAAGAEAEKPRKPSIDRRVFRGLLWTFAILFVLVVLTGGGAAFLIEIPILLLIGWIHFIDDARTSMEINPALVLEAVVVTAGIALVGHWFARWLHGALVPGAPRPWEVRWTVILWWQPRDWRRRRILIAQLFYCFPILRESHQTWEPGSAKYFAEPENRWLPMFPTWSSTGCSLRDSSLIRSPYHRP